MSQPNQFDQVSVVKKANIYFDGKCVSHTIHLPDGTQKTLGVIMPSSLRFETRAPERMELVAGECRVKLADEADFTVYRSGQSFYVPGNSYFDIQTEEPIHYVCHFDG